MKPDPKPEPAPETREPGGRKRPLAQMTASEDPAAACGGATRPRAHELGWRG